MCPRRGTGWHRLALICNAIRRFREGFGKPFFASSTKSESYDQRNLSERHDRRPALGDDSRIAARRVAAAPPRTLRRDTELSDPPRDGPPPAHLARDAQRLGEPRADPRPQDWRARAVPRQRRRGGTAPDCPHQKPIAMKTTTDCIGIREYLLRRGLQPHRETATHGMFLSPLREERTPSFSVRYDKGLWYDFGLGEGARSSSWSCASKGAAWQKPSDASAKGPQTKPPTSPYQPPRRTKTPRCGFSASGRFDTRR